MLQWSNSDICVMSALDTTNRAIVEKVHLKCIDFFDWCFFCIDMAGIRPDIYVCIFPSIFFFKFWFQKCCRQLQTSKSIKLLCARLTVGFFIWELNSLRWKIIQQISLLQCRWILLSIALFLPITGNMQVSWSFYDTLLRCGCCLPVNSNSIYFCPFGFDMKRRLSVLWGSQLFGHYFTHCKK